MALVFLNVVDIPVFVTEGNVDCGIVGQDVIAETGLQFKHQQLLGFGRCVLAIQAPVHLHLTPVDLIGQRIVTSFPKLTRSYFETLEKWNQQKTNVDCNDDYPNNIPLVMNGDSHEKLSTKIVTLSGSVDASVSLGLSEGVVDLVDSGETMRMAGLEQISTVMKSEAVFITNSLTKHQTLLTTIKKRIEGYLTAQRYQMISYNIIKNKIQETIKLTTGLRSPDITNLADSNYVSITAVVERSKALDVIDSLDDLGAQDILIYDFKHCRI